MAAKIRQRSSSAVALTALAILGLAYAIGSAQAESGSAAEFRPWRRCPPGWEVRPDVNGTRNCILCCRNGTETCFKRCPRPIPRPFPRPRPVEPIVGAEPEEVQAGAVANENDAVFEVSVEEIDDANAFENEEYDFEIPVEIDADAGTAAAAGAAVPVQCSFCCRPRVRCHRWRCRVKLNCNKACLATCLVG